MSDASSHDRDTDLAQQVERLTDQVAELTNRVDAAAEAIAKHDTHVTNARIFLGCVLAVLLCAALAAGLVRVLPTRHYEPHDQPADPYDDTHDLPGQDPVVGEPAP